MFYGMRIALIVGCMALGVDAVTARALTESELKVVTAPVLERLTDPFSVQFDLPGVDGKDYYCARFNAKNQLGGYVGWQIFGVALKIDPNGIVVGTSELEIDEPRAYSIHVWQICNRHDDAKPWTPGR